MPTAAEWANARNRTRPGCHSRCNSRRWSRTRCWCWTELRAVSPPGVKIDKPASAPAPDDHFAAGPDSRGNVSGSRRVGGAGGCPTVRAGIVFAPGIENIWRGPIHPRRSFHCQSTLPCAKSVVGASVVLVAVQVSVLGLYLPPVFKAQSSPSTPDDHFAAGPHCRMKAPSAGAPVVLVAVQLSVVGLYFPPLFKDHKRKNPPQTIISLPVQTAVCPSGLGRVGSAGRGPTIRARIISPAGVQIGSVFESTPDDHFTASPTAVCILSATRRVGGAGGCPTVRARIVSPAGVQIVAAIIYPPQTIISLPVHTTMWPARHRRVGGAGGCPTVRAWIVPSASVKIDSNTELNQ